eukprot:8141073-Pyramimonas_sp.AAC.1
MSLAAIPIKDGVGQSLVGRRQTTLVTERPGRVSAGRGRACSQPSGRTASKQAPASAPTAAPAGLRRGAGAMLR